LRRSVFWSSAGVARAAFGASPKQTYAKIDRMPEDPAAIPLADVLRAANELVSAALARVEQMLDQGKDRQSIAGRHSAAL
jgi:hypothetical protein